MKPRGTLARLTVLEEQAQHRAAQVEAVKEDLWGRVYDRLTPADRQAVDDLSECMNDPARWGVVTRLEADMDTEPLPHPFQLSAWAWSEQVDATPEGVPWPLPQAGEADGFRAYDLNSTLSVVNSSPTPGEAEGFTAYFGVEAARAEQVCSFLILAPDLWLYAAGSAALWRFEALFVRVLLEGAT